MTSTLLAPLTFRNGRSSRNRVVLAAMTNLQSHADGTLSDDELHWLERRADGGFGVITSCASHVSADGQGWSGELGVFDDRHVPGLRVLADAMHRRGALALVQIFHGGLRADAALTGVRTWSASESAGGPRAATEDDLRRVIADFGEAARRARDAGMDGVEIHGAHGYLLTQFLSTVENRRTDAWGGPLENRARLLREVTRRVRSAVPDDFLVGVRISPEDFGNAKGVDVDENVEVARWLVADGIDFLHLSLGDTHRNSNKHPDRHMVQLFRPAVPANVKLFVAGKIWTAADGERLLAMGADAVALARSAIINPDWPQRIATSGWEPERPPVSADALRERGLGARFVDYLRARPGFIA